MRRGSGMYRGWILTVALLAALAGALGGAQSALARGFAPASVPTFGEEGSGPGQFRAPAGISAGSEGDLLVADGGNQRVQNWAPGADGGGSFLSAFTGAGTPSPEFSEAPFGVAVEGSSAPLPGYVFVTVYNEGKTLSPVDEFRPKLGEPNEYEYVCQFTGPGSGCLPNPAGEGGGSSKPFKEAEGVALDGAGDLFIASSKSIYELASGGSEVVLLHEFPSLVLGVAVEGNQLYAVTFNSGFTGEVVKLEVEAATQKVIGESTLDEKGSQKVAVSPSGDVYVLDDEGGAHVEVFDAAGASTGEAFGAGQISEIGQIAYDAANEDVYVTNPPGNDVQVFTPVFLPVVKTEAAKEVTAESAVLTGSVNPEGEEGTRYYFEWGEKSVEEHTTAVDAVTTGTAPMGVEAKIAGLKPRHTYSYELFAYNEHDQAQAEHVAGGVLDVITEPSPPIVTSTSVAEVFAREATLDAQIDPEGEATTYHFEYGETEAYGQSTREAGAGEGEAPVFASATISGLRPETTYHFRVVARNATGTVEGPDRTLTTYPPPSAFALPDGRAYEQVSPVEKGTDALGEPQDVRGAASGEAVTFLSMQPFPGVEAATQLETYVATRSPGGWHTQGLLPPTQPDSTGTEPVGATADLAYTVVRTNDPPPGARGGTPGEYDYYLRDNATGSWSLFVKDVAKSSNPEEEEVYVAGNSADDSRIFFETGMPLLEGAPEGVFSLYEWHDGAISFAGVLPAAQGGKPPAAGAAAASAARFYVYPEGTVSRDGSRVFFTDRGTGEIYLRENGATTVPVSGLASSEPAVFHGATPGGSRAFFTLQDGDLYMFETASERVTDIAPRGEVQGVAGMGGEGAYVYFVAKSVLSDNGNADGAEAAAGKDNLYLWHEGEPVRFIAVLSEGSPSLDQPADVRDWEVGESLQNPKHSRVSADGTRLMFTSYAKQTGYENYGPRCKGEPNGEETRPGYCQEIYLYDASSDSLSCLSCNQSGAPADYTAELYSAQPYPPKVRAMYPRILPRNLSENGRRAFFQTREALTPQDKDGQTDVYEWEEAGEGSCPSSHTGGCLYLISSGESPYPSYFGEASASGDDVFFFTRQKLVGQDLGEEQDLYDARVHGGIPSQNPSPPTPPCSGEACLDAAAAAPLLGSPASATLAGRGNLMPRSAHSKEVKKRLTRAHRLRRALRACKKRRRGKPRASCKRRARHRYGAKAISEGRAR